MVVAVPVYRSRVAPLLDAAAEALAVRFHRRGELDRFTVRLAGLSTPERVVRLSEQGVHAVICAGLSGHMLRMLGMWGIQVAPGVVGDVERVVQAFRTGTLDHPQFHMPGCRRGRRRLGWGRRRH
jgi:predicted Fe-Mo cluster-binding NifX family protein